MNKVPHNSEKTLLAVLAHPDDETFGMGGTIALYAQRGVDVHLICATRGEVGEIDPQYKERIKSAACLRTQELRCAAEALGIGHLYFLDYRDSGMPGSQANNHPKALAAQPVEKVAREVTHLMRKIKPTIVITFDPIGGYRHPDHIAIQRAAVQAFNMVSDKTIKDPEGLPAVQPEKLYFNTINRFFLRAVVWILRLLGKDPHKFGQNQDIDLVSIAKVNFPTHAKINYYPVMGIREKAARCHASQGGNEMNKGFQGFVTRLFGGHYETFMQAYPKPETGMKVKRDLFE